MLSQRIQGPMRLAASSSRLCGARLVVPFAPCWRRAGIVTLPRQTYRDVRLPAAKRGRPRKPETEPPPSNPDTEAPPEGDDDGVQKRRGRKSRKAKAQEEARDLLESQQVDLEVLEEFKARAAAEEAARQQIMGNTGEDDPRRLNFHRSLLAASQRGMTDECAQIMDSMADAGLTPGPRACHVWAYAYIQAGDGPAARRVAEEARETYGITWIPETYVALMHGCLSCSPGGPDLMGVLEVWLAQQDAGANPQSGFTFLTKELFRLRYSALAMQVVSEGYAAGYQPDAKLAALVIEQLCKQGLMTEAQSEMQRLLDAGELVGPEHYDTIVRLEAASGNTAGAREMLQTYYNDSSRYAPPRTSSYTALIRGLGSSLRSPPLPGFGGAAEAGAGEQDAEGGALTSGGGGGVIDAEPEQLDRMLGVLREEMMARGLRPDRETYAAIVEAHVAVGDMDSALLAYETLTRAKGSPALMRKKYLGRLVVSLLLTDRPIDALRLLRDCASTPAFSDARSCVSLPASAAAPLSDPAAEGRSALSVWLGAHLEMMAARRGQRTSVMAFMREADLSSRREFDGVVLGLGGCVVTEDGLFVPPSKMTLTELRAELGAAGGEGAAAAVGAARKDLVRLVKERRDRLPSALLEMQAHLEGLVAAREAERKAREAGEEEEAEEEVAEDEERDPTEEMDVNIQSILADEDTFEGGESIEDSATFRAAAVGRLDMGAEPVDVVEGLGEGEEEEDEEYEEYEEGDDEEDEEVFDEEEDEEDGDEDMEEGFGDDVTGAGAGKRRRRRRRGAAPGDDDDEEVEDDDAEEDDEEGLGFADDDVPLNDGLGLGVRAGGEDLDGDDEDGGLRRLRDDSDDNLILDQVLNMGVLDGARYNATAGIVAAMRMLELWVAVGLTPTPADLLALYEGAMTEAHPRAAADLAEQLPVLQANGAVSAAQLAEMLTSLAGVCLGPENPDGEAGDTVVTLMEERNIQVPADIYSALEVALDGRPRMRDVVLGEGGELQADLSGSGIEGTVAIEDEDEAAVVGAFEGPSAGEGEEEAAEEEEEGEGGEYEEGEEEEGEGEEELFGDYEEDPGALEVERLEFERLFQRDGEEDDAWLDELEEQPVDVEEVRAAAKAEAAAVAAAELVEEKLAAVRARSEVAAALLEKRLTAVRQLMLEVAEAKAAEAEAKAALPASSTAAEGSPGGEVAAVAGPEPVVGDADELEEDEGDDGIDLDEMAAEAEWDTSPLVDLPPAVLAAAAEATAAELAEDGTLTVEDRDALKRIAAKAHLLANLAEINASIALRHPSGADVAEAEIAAAVADAQEFRATTTYEIVKAGAAAAAAGARFLEGPLPEEQLAAAKEREPPEEVLAAMAKVIGGEGNGEEDEEGGPLPAGVDEDVLDGEEAEALASVMAEAEALLAEEEAADRVVTGAGFGPGWDEGTAEAEAQHRVLQELLGEADRAGPRLNARQKKMYELVERGDVEALESLVGREALAWFMEDMKRLAKKEEIDYEEGEAEAVGPRLAPGWQLSPAFLARFSAILTELADEAEAEGVYPPAADLTLETLTAMAMGYKLRREREAEEQGTQEAEVVGAEEEEDAELEALQEEAKTALVALEEEMGGEGEAAASRVATEAMNRVLARQAELASWEIEDLEAEMEEEAAAEGGEREELDMVEDEGGGWEEEGEGEEAREGEEEEGEMDEGELMVANAMAEAGLPAPVPPEEAARLLAALQQHTGPVYVAPDVEQDRAEDAWRWVALAAAARMATEAEDEAGEVQRLREEEEEEEEEAPPPSAKKRGSGRGRGSGGVARGRGRRGSR